MRVVGVEWLQLRRRVWLDKGYLRIGEAEAAQVALCPPADHIHLYVKDKAGTATPYWKDENCVEHEFADVAGIPPAYTDEQAQDAVGNILVDSSSIDFTYNDATPSITAIVLPAGVNHNLLANLTVGDPHTQYVLEASTEWIDLTDGGTTTLHSHAGGLTGSGVSGRVAFWTGISSLGSDSTLFWDDAQNNLGIGTGAPASKLDVQGSVGTVCIRAASNTDGDIWYYATGTTGLANVFLTSVSASNAVYALFANTSSAANTRAILECQVAAATSGDPYFQLTVSGATAWGCGIDNSNGDRFVFDRSGNPSGGFNVLALTTSDMVLIGSIVNPPGTGTYGIVFEDGTALSSMASNTAGIYANDVAGTVNMFAINEAGAVTQLSGVSGTYTPSNVTTDRSYDANATTIDELADVLGTLIADLQTRGVLA